MSDTIPVTEQDVREMLYGPACHSDKELRDEIIHAYHKLMLTIPSDGSGQYHVATPMMRAMRKAAFTYGKKCYA